MSGSIAGDPRLTTLAQHILLAHGDEDKQERVPHLIQTILSNLDARFSSLSKEDRSRIFEAAKAARAISLSQCQFDAGPAPLADVPVEAREPSTAKRTEETSTSPPEPGTAADPGDVIIMAMDPENSRKHRRGSSDDGTSGRPSFKRRGDSSSPTDPPSTENDVPGIKQVARRHTSVETEGYLVPASTDDSQLAGGIEKNLSGSTLQADASVPGSLDPVPPSSQQDDPDAGFLKMAPANATIADIPVLPRLNHHPTQPFQILKFIDGSSTPDVRDVQFELDDAHAALIKRWNDRYDVFECVSNLLSNCSSVDAEIAKGRLVSALH